MDDKDRTELALALAKSSSLLAQVTKELEETRALHKQLLKRYGLMNNEYLRSSMKTMEVVGALKELASSLGEDQPCRESIIKIREDLLQICKDQSENMNKIISMGIWPT